MRLSRIIGLQKPIMQEIHWCLKTEKENPIYFLKWCRINCFSQCKRLFFLFFFKCDDLCSPICCSLSEVSRGRFGDACFLQVRPEPWVWFGMARKGFISFRIYRKKIQECNVRSHLHSSVTEDVFWEDSSLQQSRGGGGGEKGRRGGGEGGRTGEGEVSSGGCSCWSDHGDPANTAASLSQQTATAPTKEIVWDGPGEDRWLQWLQLYMIQNRVILELWNFLGTFSFHFPPETPRTHILDLGLVCSWSRKVNLAQGELKDAPMLPHSYNTRDRS